jgi:ABC-type branched-subunit amino acid transport system substrate-binding protein
MTPIVQAIKGSNSTFVSDGVTPPNVVLLRKEAQLQGVNSVKAWVCASGCYADYFTQTGGSSVNGTYQVLSTLPFFTESDKNPELKSIADLLGGIKNIDSNSLSAYVEGLLFEDAVTKATSGGGTLTRKSLINALRTQETAFDAKGIIGQTNVSKKVPSPCFVEVQVKDGQFQRVYPTAAGTFDCNASNLVQVKQGV